MKKIFILTGLLGILFGILIRISDAAPPPWEMAEKFVIDQVSEGKEANLLKEFSGRSETYRQLRSKEFIEKLLTNSLEDVKVGRHGVKIIGGIILKPLNLENADIRHEIWLDHCEFHEEVQFALSTFKKGLSFNGSVFYKTVNFSDMKVDGNFYFKETKFHENVQFKGTKVSGQFQATSARFLFNPSSNSDENNRYSANFDLMQVQRSMFFDNAIFIGPASLVGVNVGGNMLWGDPKQESFKLHELNLAGAHINRNLLIENGLLQNLIAPDIRVNGFAKLNMLTIEDKVNFGDSKFWKLYLYKVTWPDKPGSIRLGGISFQNISAGDEKDSWRKLLDFVNSAEYSVSAYRSLEDFFINQGYQSRADKVYIESKWRERKKILKGFWNWPSRFIDLFLWAVVGYGRRPWLALFWSIGFIVFGSCCFWKETGMVRKNSDHSTMQYNPLWYSLDLFVPVVDLQAAKFWVPQQDRRFARNYSRFHIIFGWLLVPIGLAAWTGIIR